MSEEKHKPIRKRSVSKKYLEVFIDEDGSLLINNMSPRLSSVFRQLTKDRFTVYCG